jgi:hypothetical protein
MKAYQIKAGTGVAGLERVVRVSRNPGAHGRRRAQLSRYQFREGSILQSPELSAHLVLLAVIIAVNRVGCAQDPHTAHEVS